MPDPYNASKAARGLLTALDELDAFVEKFKGLPVENEAGRLPPPVDGRQRPQKQELHAIEERINRYAIALGICPISDPICGLRWDGRNESRLVPGYWTSTVFSNAPTNTTYGCFFIGATPEFQNRMQQVREMAKVHLESWRTRLLTWVVSTAAIAGILGFIAGRGWDFVSELCQDLFR